MRAGEVEAVHHDLDLVEGLKVVRGLVLPVLAPPRPCLSRRAHGRAAGGAAGGNLLSTESAAEVEVEGGGVADLHVVSHVPHEPAPPRGHPREDRVGADLVVVGPRPATVERDWPQK